MIREENILSMKIRANNIDLKGAKRFDSFFSVISNCEIKYCCSNIFIKVATFNFAVENDARKAVETLCIFKINIVSSNFRVQKKLCF